MQDVSANDVGVSEGIGVSNALNLVLTFAVTHAACTNIIRFCHDFQYRHGAIRDFLLEMAVQTPIHVDYCEQQFHRRLWETITG